MANKIIHKHSSVVTDGKAKIPTASQLEYGELAVNYAAGVETITLKNSNNEIVEIKPASYLEEIIEENELATAGELSALNTKIDTIYSEIEDNEFVVATSLTDLDSRVSAIENGGIDTSTLVSKDELATSLSSIDDDLNAIDARLITTKIITGTTPTISVLEENTYYVCNSPVSKLTISDIENDASAEMANYKIIFKVSTTAPQINFPSSILWANGDIPVIIDVNSIYEVDIEKIIIGGTASYRGVVVQFK